MIKTILKLIKSYWEWDIKPFFKAFFPENKVEIRSNTSRYGDIFNEEEPSGYIEDHINEEWDVEDDDAIGYSRERDTSDNVPKPPFVQEEKGFI